MSKTPPSYLSHLNFWALFTYTIILNSLYSFCDMLFASFLPALAQCYLALVFIIISVQAYPTFSEYCQQYGKQYQASQVEFRENIYNSRIDYFATITDYVPGVNNLTDWTDEEIDRLKNLEVLPENQRTPDQQDQIPLIKLGASSLNWYTKGKVTPVKNQGACGSCWSFATAAVAESRLVIDGKYSVWNIDLSEQYLLQCTPFSSCNGGYMEDSMKTGRTIPKQSQFPYYPFYSYPGICSAKGISIASSFKKYYGISDSQIIALLQDSPIVVGLSAKNWEYYSYGTFSCSFNDLINHAVLLVGYTPNAWIIKNSWGSSFGLSGYIYINRDKYRNCHIGSYVYTFAFEHWFKFTISLGVLLIIFIL